MAHHSTSPQLLTGHSNGHQDGELLVGIQEHFEPAKNFSNLRKIVRKQAETAVRLPQGAHLMKPETASD